MEAATALMATASTGTGGSKQSGSSAPQPATSSTSTPPKNNNSRKRRKQFGGNSGNSGGNSGSPGTPERASNKNSQSAPTGGTPHNPWTGVVQAWPMMHWRPASSGLLGTRPPLPQQALLATMPGTTPTMNTFGYSTPPGLASALTTMTPTAQYQGGGDWYMDTGASAHMANDSGSANEDGTAPM